MESAPLIMQGFTTFACPFLSSTQRTKVLRCLGHNRFEELKCDATCGLAPDTDIKVNLRVAGTDGILQWNLWIVGATACCILIEHKKGENTGAEIHRVSLNPFHPR